MLSTQTAVDQSAKIPFPYPGSEALWQLRPCTIYSRNADGTLVITGESVRRRTVSPDELLDPDKVALTPFGRWIAEQVGPGYGRIHPIEDILQNYLLWLRAAGIDEDRAILPYELGDRLERAGLKRTPTLYRPLFTRQTRPTFGFDLELKAGTR